MNREVEEGLCNAFANLSTKRLEKRMPDRPDGGGKLGRAIKVLTNCWDIEFVDKAYHCYHLEVEKITRVDNEKREVKLPAKEKRALGYEIVKT